MSRCIPVVLEDGTAESQDQAVAVCNSMWEEANKEQDKMEKQMERKTFHGFVTKADEEQGIVEAYFAVFGNIDQGNDVIHPGAFTKTFLERGGKVRVLDNHRTDTIERAIGKPLLLKEVGREDLPPELLAQNPEATGGAFARVQMLMDTPEGKGAFIRLRDGAIDEWSFGYDALDTDFSSAMKDGEEINVRNLRTLRLYEISPVLFGMNEATTTVSAKASHEFEEKAITDEDKRVIKQELRGLSMTNLVATHRRLHNMAAQGNMLTGFTRADMNWFHASTEQELRRRATEDDREPPEATPLEWDSKEGEEPESSDDEKCFPSRIAVIRDREKAGHYVISPKEGRLADVEIHRIKELWDAMWKTGAKAMVVDVPIEITKLDEEAPLIVVKEAATDNQNEEQAGPDTPPTSNVLDELKVLRLQTETLEVSYGEEQGVARKE
ncbi:MAG: HK97 family phage prohead protease [Phycisphaerales bacterium]